MLLVDNLIIYQPFLIGLQIYSYHNLYLNLLKRTGTDSGNDSIETDPVEDGEDADNEQEKISQRHLPTAATVAVTAVQLQWLCSLHPPSKTATAVAKKISIGQRFAAIVWDGLVTALYDLWPIVHSKALPPSPVAFSTASVFQFNKQQVCVRDSMQIRFATIEIIQ
jgi:hypothetical protein